MKKTLAAVMAISAIAIFAVAGCGKSTTNTKAMQSTGQEVGEKSDDLKGQAKNTYENARETGKEAKAGGEEVVDDTRDMYGEIRD